MTIKIRNIGASNPRVDAFDDMLFRGVNRGVLNYKQLARWNAESHEFQTVRKCALNEEDEKIGGVMFSPTSMRSDSTAAVMTLDYLTVEEEYRRQGVGKDLFLAGFKQCRTNLEQYGYKLRCLWFYIELNEDEKIYDKIIIALRKQLKPEGIKVSVKKSATILEKGVRLVDYKVSIIY